MSNEKLREIPRKHKLYLLGEKEGERGDLSWADFRGNNLSYTDFREINLSGADFRGANLRYADLSGANLRYANLSGADLSCADLSCADLSYANLSGAKGLLSPIDFLSKNFEKTNEGYIAYKTFNSTYSAPSYWKIEAGEIISENVLFDRCAECECGINVAPLEYVRDNYEGDIWKVLIRWEWLPGVCVPYNSDGVIRCERAELLEIV